MKDDMSRWLVWGQHPKLGDFFTLQQSTFSGPATSACLTMNFESRRIQNIVYGNTKYLRSIWSLNLPRRRDELLPLLRSEVRVISFYCTPSESLPRFSRSHVVLSGHFQECASFQKHIPSGGWLVGGGGE